MPANESHMSYAKCDCINFVPWCYYQNSEEGTQQPKTSGYEIAIVHKIQKKKKKNCVCHHELLRLQ